MSPTLGWRWSFWIALIIAGVSFVGVVLLPETYGPKLLTEEAKRQRRSGRVVFGPLEIETESWQERLRINLATPLHMLFTELIVAASCLYLAFLYGNFYMFFGAYPIIFRDLYGMSPCISGLTVLPIGVGCCAAIAIGVWFESYSEGAKLRNRPWSMSEEARRLPLACIGGPITTVSMFWLGWAAQKQIHWGIPCASGFFYGLGSQLIFNALSNYLADAYPSRSASAFAASGCTRSIFGVVLPFAVPRMYSKLGISWATSVLGFFCLAMCCIPFAFIRYGRVIRRHSKLCVSV